MSVRMDDAIREFIAYREGAGYPRSTVRINTNGLELLLRQTGNINVKGLEARHGEMFKSWMLGKGYSANSINTHLTTLRAFAKWAKLRRYMPPNADPLATTRAMRVAQKPRQRVDREDFGSLLDAAPWPSARISAALGLYLFLRGSDVSNLRVGGARLDRGEIEVWVQKTGQWDVMPICEELDAELRRWLTFYAEDQQAPLDPEWFLVPPRRPVSFHTSDGKGGGKLREREQDTLNPSRRNSTPYLNVKATLSAFGWETTRGEGNHTLRRSGARAWFDEMVESGDVRDGVLRKVSAMLHHSSVRTTEVYLGLEADVESRNEILRGRRMFRSSGHAGNVVELRPASEM